MRYTLLALVIIPFNLFALDWSLFSSGKASKSKEMTPEKLNEKLFDNKNDSFLFLQRDGSRLIVKKDFLEKEIAFVKMKENHPSLVKSYYVDFYNRNGNIVLEGVFNKESTVDFIKAIFGKIFPVKTK